MLAKPTDIWSREFALALPLAGHLPLPDWWWLGVVVSIVGRINEVNQHRARLVPGWVTVSGLTNHLGV